MSFQPKKVLLCGATGTIGRATARAAVEAGLDVTCLVRRPVEVFEGAATVQADVTDAASVDAVFASGFDVVISCLASRTGAPEDAWAIDDRANRTVFDAAKAHGAPHVILLSAICVQKPRLAFQHAKLSAETALIESGLTYTVVRPTAFFKSLSGQIARVQAGRSFLVFGDGHLTACKPISDRDLGQFLVKCIDLPGAKNAVVPIGGRGPAITPRDQADHLFGLLGKDSKIGTMPVIVMKTIAGGLGFLSRIVPSFTAKAEFARIGLYYATESMLVWNEAEGRYDADATPSFGEDTLFDYYADVIAGRATVEKGDHSVF
ncbi:MAG: NAD(P)H-binding protein [Pseudomonadota bacterium]